MNTKTLFKLGTMLAIMLVLVVGNAFAAKYYVNVVSGLDGYDGLAPLYTTGATGPKQTINNAITAASPGDTIVVDYGNGNLYNEVVNANKLIVLATSNNTGTGVPVVYGLNVNNAVPAPNNIVKFINPFSFTTGMTLTVGVVNGANNITVATSVTRVIAASTVDAQINYSGTVNFFYNAAMSTGLEMVAASNTTNAGNLTTTAGILTLGNSITINGILTTAAGLNIVAGQTLTIVGANAHVVAGNVVNGTMAFTLSGGNASVTGNFDLPAVTATTSSATARTLTLNTTTGIGDITAASAASVTVASAIGTGVGNVTNNGSGTIILTLATATKSLTNTSSGSITPLVAGLLTVTGNVTQSGTGNILFVNAVTISGSVTQNAALTWSAAATVYNAASNRSAIRFAGDFAVTIGGSVTNTTSFAGASNANVVTWGNVGEISFAATTAATVITGAVVVNPSHGLTYGGTTGSGISNSGGVTFASTTGAVTITGGISNSTNWNRPSSSFTMAGNGDVNMSARTTGVLTVGAITSTSLTTQADGAHGNILLGGTTGNVVGSSVTTSGGTGGLITIGGTTATFGFSGTITNSRTPSGVVYLGIGGGVATAGVSVSIGGDLVQNGAARTSFPSFLGNAGENFTVTGALNVSAGSVYVNNGAQTGGGAFTFGTVTLTGGTVDIGAAASVMNIVVQGNATFTGGTWKSGGAVGRQMRLGGLVNKFSAPSNRTDFVSGVGMGNVLLLLQPVSVVALQTFTGDNTQTIWPGPMQVVNGSGLTPAAKFTGGNFRFLGNVSFTTGQVEVNGVTLFVGGQLAPYLGAGNFVNAAGYISTSVGVNQGFISLNGNAAGQAVSGAGKFGNFEADNNSGAGAVTIAAATGDFTGTFNLTNGQVVQLAAGCLVFNNTTTPPTIVVNSGTLAAAPTFTSMVSVYYIGVDKFTGFELPAASDKLFNLTVATTNGTNVIGKGVVRINNVATTVNGSLNIFGGQALNMVGTTTITLLGPTASIVGDLAGDLATNTLNFAAATGTAVSGAGALPNIVVAFGSVGNSISGSVGLATQLLGADQIRGTDDVNTGLVGANGGSIVYTGGAASSLTAGFGTPNATTNAHLDFVTTAAGATFTLGADLIQAGILTHNSGTVSDGTFTYTLLSAGPHVLNTAASVTGTGTLQFKLGASTTLNAAGGAATIATNVKLLNPANVAAFSVTLGLNDLTIGGDLTLVAGGAVGTTTLALGALNLTVTGSAVTMNTNSSITGTGVVTFNATTAPLTFTYTGAPTIANLTIKNDVVLAGTGTGLVVTGIFNHNAGNLNFGARDLTSSGTYTRGTGTYTATTGYFIFSGTTFNQGTTGYSIPNLRFTNAGGVTAGGTGVVLVTTALDVNTPAGAPSFTHAGTLSVADGASVLYTQGSFDVAPVYVGVIDLYAYNVGIAIPASVWPAAPVTLVRSFIVDNGGGNVLLAAGRTVNMAMYLNSGTLALVANTLTMADNSTVYRTNLGNVTATTGGLVYGTGMTLVYQANGVITTGIELPASIANLTFTRSANGINRYTTLSTDVTVTGLLSIRNNVNDVGTVTVKAAGNVEVLNESGTWSNATNPVVNLSNLTFSGTGNQVVTVGANGATIANLRIAQTGTGSTVTVSGGALTVGTSLSFVNGILVTGTFPIVLGGTVDRSGLTGLSHIYGTVQRTIAVLGRYEYPVGSMTKYRPIALTFPTTAPPAAGITVQHVDADPIGILGLPVPDPATGIRIGGYPKYYWLVKSTISLGQSIPYDMELVGTEPFGRPLNKATDLRIIHRFDGNDTYNPWYLEGTGTNYLNFLSLAGPDTVATVRVRGSFGGIVPEASRYTIGIPTRPPVWTVAPATLTVNEGAALSQQFTGDPQDVGETMAYTLTTAPAGMAISATGLLTWTPGYDQAGVKNVVISATDGEFIITQNVAVTVVNVNRAPVFAPKTAALTKTDKDTVKVVLAATDADSDPLTYSFGSITPASTNAPTVTGSTLMWLPAFADAGQTFTITAIVSDGITTGQGPTPGRDTMTVTVVVNRSRKLGDADGNGTVQAADAAIVLQKVAGLITVTDPAALWAMDASKNGTITAYDASLILQAAAGLIPALSGNISDAGLSKGAAMQATGVLEMANPQSTTNPEVVKVGIKLSNPANVYSVTLSSKADFSLLTIDAVNATLPEGWDMKWNVVNGELRIAAAGTTPLSSGDVASIMVHLKSKESRVSFSSDAMLNENYQSLGSVEVAAIPTVYALDQNYPNPFNPSTTIRYQIPTDASVNLIIYNVQGQKIRTLVSKEQKAGYYNVVWDGRNEAGQTVSTGLYLYRVQAGSFVATQKMLMLK